MRHLLLLVVISLFLLAAFGCSGNNANTDVNANTSGESPFSNITDASAALAEGNRLLDENQIEMAIAAYQQAIKLDPDLADAHFQLGIAYSLLAMQNEHSGDVGQDADGSKARNKAQKAFEHGVEAYKKYLAANPKDDVAQFNLGRTYAKLTKDDLAKDAFREAVRLKPDDTEYQTELGAVLIKLAKYHEAIGPLKKAVELDPTNGRAQDLLEDAEAGRQRVDYVSPKSNSNQANSNANANSNVNANMASNSNTSVRLPDGNTRPARTPTPLPVATPREVPRSRIVNPTTKPKRPN